MSSAGTPESELSERDLDVEEAPGRLLRDLRSTAEGLTTREAERRLLQHGPNELRRRGGRRWPMEIARQLTHPLALLLWLAAALSMAVGSQTVAIAVVLVIILNAAFAFVQELQAEKAVEALASYLPQQAIALRDGAPHPLPAPDLVPGDVVLVGEGERIAADMRLLSGSLEVDLSTLTGESVPVIRAADLQDTGVPRLAARDLVFTGTTAVAGDARGLVFATGMHSELGRIAALSQRAGGEPSPLERQVRRVAWLIAAIAVAMSLAFVPLAIGVAGLSVKDSVVFAVGLLAGNVPEGLLPVITLALAVAVGLLARRGALVKRLSAVETLGCTDVICTDKTGTLTENRMRPVAAWTVDGEIALDGTAPATAEPRSAAVAALAETAARCNDARLDEDGAPRGDPTEVALLQAARGLGVELAPSSRDRDRRLRFNFDPELKLMSTLDADADGKRVRVHTKGAPESVLPRCTHAVRADGRALPLDDAARGRIAAQVERYAHHGLRVLALANTESTPGQHDPQRADVERDLTLSGLVTMFDAPREEVADAVARCHTAGIRIIVITGDHPATAAAIARQVGIGGDRPRVVTSGELDHRHEADIERALATGDEVIFARASPEAKLHIAEVLRGQGHVVAMTGDGVNDAPALRRADIGVAMGRSGTDVAREAATMILTDDNFATIVAAVEAGRQVYDNVRKFIVYIFAHATPEVVPFLLFALAGGTIPLPLPILLLLAFDVGTETLPSLALGRDPAEPGTMERPPRRRGENVISRAMLIRAWLFLGLINAAFSLGCFFIVLTGAGWHAGAATGGGAPLHHAYMQATTMMFLALIAGQIGTAFAVRTERASLRSVGALSNRYLLIAIAAELLVAAAIVYAPPLQSLLDTAGPPAHDLALLAAGPLLVWGADELRRLLLRRGGRSARHGSSARAPDPRGRQARSS